MLEEHYDKITKIENLIDGLMVVDEKGFIKFNKQFSDNNLFLNEKKSIGKRPWDVWPNLSTESSTCYRAIKYGETNKNQIQHLTHESGIKLKVLDNTFPIKKDGKIIGAVSYSQYIDQELKNDFIDLPNMTSTHQNNLYKISDIVGKSEKIKNLKYKIHKLAQTDSTVLIYGETGTGKELVAQSIHSASKRENEKFISQNCAAIPNTLLESIFFGTTKGSYTGAENKEGIFERADGGTIFLDEINSMDLDMQAKLLKAIEEKQITRIGGSETINTNVRIIAALNKNPKLALKEGEIRKDLYYRLSSIQLTIPPLKKRKSDIKLLTKHFINIYNKKMNKNIEGITDEVLEIFYEYNWPGNVRELKNVIESAFNFATGKIITKSDLPSFLFEDNKENFSQNEDNSDLKKAVEKYEKNLIIKKAEEVSSLTKLAEKLSISKQNLNYKINKYSLKLDI